MSRDHTSEIFRIDHDGHIYKWERRGAAWPGHTTYVAIRTGEVILGDRYAHEGFHHRHTCHPRDLLDGCFHEVIVAEFGQAVLDEVIAEVRATEYLPEQPRAKIARKPEARPVAPTKSAEPEAAAPTPAPTPAPAPTSGRASVVLISCKTVDLPLAVALRSITRAPVKQVLARLEQLPHVLASDVPIAEAEAVKQRLASLGATIELRG